MNNAIINQEIDRGDESLKSAELLLKAGLVSDAMSRVYYAVLHNTRALLYLKDIAPKSHKGVMQLFSMYFVKTGKVSTATCKILARQQKFREEADYNIEGRFSYEDVEMEISDAKKFRETTITLLTTETSK